MKRLTVVLAAICMLAGVGNATPPDDADPALAPWYKSLRTPWLYAPCCSIADCRPVEARIAGDHYEAFVGGQWRPVHPDHVLIRTDNPTGRAVACWTPTGGITCFVPGPGM